MIQKQIWPTRSYLRFTTGRRWYCTYGPSAWSSKCVPILMEGKQFGVDKAKSLGLIHDTVENEQELLDKAIAWIKANPKSQQPLM